MANVENKGLLTGQPTGVTLAIIGGATYGPAGNGTTSLRVVDGNEGKDKDKDKDKGKD